MGVLPEDVEKLINLLERLPAIGPKSAARIAMFLLKSPEQYKKELGQLLLDLKSSIVYCSVCHNIASQDPCRICSDQRRNEPTLCVIEDPLDVVAFENSTDFRGKYHVLGGVISPVSGVGPDDLTIHNLLKRLGDSAVEEVIIATNPNIEGEATAMFIKEEINRLYENIKVTRLARGLPSGADLEYADKTTLKRAFEGRTDF